jgi:hypothetical protein
VILYHYTCDHRAGQIRSSGRLVGNAHPLMPHIGALIHLTDLDTPDRDALGLTSRILRCDRTKHRVTVETDAAVHWPRFARTIPRHVRENLESARGALPMHWYIATEPIRIASIEVASCASS